MWINRAYTNITDRRAEKKEREKERKKHSIESKDQLQQEFMKLRGSVSREEWVHIIS